MGKIELVFGSRNSAKNTLLYCLQRVINTIMYSHSKSFEESALSKTGQSNNSTVNLTQQYDYIAVPKEVSSEYIFGFKMCKVFLSSFHPFMLTSQFTHFRVLLGGKN